jgi:hypothetical protein
MWGGSLRFNKDKYRDIEAAHDSFVSYRSWSIFFHTLVEFPQLESLIILENCLPSWEWIFLCLGEGGPAHLYLQCVNEEMAQMSKRQDSGHLPINTHHAGFYI